MIAFTDFLANNYLWFLVISLVLIFSLIGYFVDQAEQKKGVSMFVKEKPVEKDIHELAVNAANKSITAAVADAVKNGTTVTQETPVMPQNTITEMGNNNQINPTESQNTNPVGFDVLSK